MTTYDQIALSEIARIRDELERVTGKPPAGGTNSRKEAVWGRPAAAPGHVTDVPTGDRL